MSEREWQLPDGSLVKDPNEMARAWQKLYQPFEKILDMKVNGFNPTVLFVKNKRQCLDIPAWALIAIAEYLDMEKVNAIR